MNWVIKCALCTMQSKSACNLFVWPLLANCSITFPPLYLFTWMCQVNRKQSNCMFATYIFISMNIVALCVKRERVWWSTKTFNNSTRLNKTKSKCNNDPKKNPYFNLAWAVVNRNWCSFISVQCRFFCVIFSSCCKLKDVGCGMVYNTWCAATLN